MPPLSWGLSSVPAAHLCPTVLMRVGLPCLGKALFLQLHICVSCFIAKLRSALALPPAPTVSLMPV